MSRIRVLVAEDSMTVRKRFVEMLATDREIEVVGEAADGKSCIELCRQLRPDVITLDMVMPVMSGLDATEYIMAYCPTPILIVSASCNRGDLFKTYAALGAGAVDVLEKPHSEEEADLWAQTFIPRVKLVSHIGAITHLRGRLSRGSRDRPRTTLLAPRPGIEPNDFRLVAIGTSTGGPAAIVEILHNLPSDFPLPILLVIHISEALGGFLAEWLDSQSPLRVSYAKDGELLPEVGHGRVIMAPPDRHLVLCDGHIRLRRTAERHSCRPSVDVLFESLAGEVGKRTVGCLLTGMGKDGAAGLLDIRNTGGVTLAQDEATSVVFGMPQEAIRLGAAERVLGIQEVAPTLVALARRPVRVSASGSIEWRTR
ncbi:MAG: chemotaxis-specific protein-glutamate methyltransferase CheB [Terriglobales bacterium]|jgi:two-component system chemotaxis response regulator CheB